MCRHILTSIMVRRTAVTLPNTFSSKRWMMQGMLLPEDEIAQKKAQAEDLLSQLRSSDDPQTLFDQLMAEYNEDTGEPSEGYTFGPGRDGG